MVNLHLNTIKISVIVPTYKPSGYLQECLESLRVQTLNKKLFEIILVLNGSGESYRLQIQSYLENNCKDMNINFISVNEAGVSNARNIAIEVSSGDYITFIDDDDRVSPNYLEELYKKASPDTISLCYPLAFIDGDNKYFPYYITDEYLRGYTEDKCDYKKVRRYFNGPVYKLIHRSIIGNRRFDTSFKNGEDSLFMFLISDRINKVSFTSKDAIYYRRYRENSATTHKRSQKEVFKNVLRLIKEYTLIYISAARKYSLNFYLTRVLAAIKSL